MLVLLIIFNRTSLPYYRETSTNLNPNINFIWPFSKLFVFFIQVLFNLNILNSLTPVPTKGSKTLK